MFLCLLQGMKKVKSTGFAGYTAEEIEAAGKADLQVNTLSKIVVSISGSLSILGCFLYSANS